MQPHPSRTEVVQDSETHPHICGACHSDLVQPLEWAAAGTSHWQITLRCPECEWCGTGVFSEETVAHFQTALEAGEDAIICDMLSLARSSFEDEIERFVTALHAGHIVPEDF